MREHQRNTISAQATFLMHDGNKNVTDVITVGPHNSPVAHYEYAPFGAATHTGPRALDNPFRFSSEFADDTLGLVYYNYRHYDVERGVFTSRDPLEEYGQLYLFLKNAPANYWETLGLSSCPVKTLLEITNYYFVIRMATEVKLEANLQKQITSWIEDVMREEIKKASPDMRDAMDKLEQVAKSIKETASFSNRILFFLTSTGPYIKSWEMGVEINFHCIGDCNEFIEREEFSAFEYDVFYCIYNFKDIDRFVAAVARGTAQIVKEVNQKVDELNEDE